MCNSEAALQDAPEERLGFGFLISSSNPDQKVAAKRATNPVAPRRRAGLKTRVRLPSTKLTPNKTWSSLKESRALLGFALRRTTAARREFRHFFYFSVRFRLETGHRVPRQVGTPALQKPSLNRFELGVGSQKRRHGRRKREVQALTDFLFNSTLWKNRRVAVNWIKQSPECAKNRIIAGPIS